MKSIFSNLRQDIAATVYMANEPVYLPVENDDDPYAYYRAPTAFEVWRRRNLPTFIVLYDRARWLVLDRVCAVRGHKWVDDSYGGPESGCMAGHCERCGFSFHETLY